MLRCVLVLYLMLMIIGGCYSNKNYGLLENHVAPDTTNYEYIGCNTLADLVHKVYIDSLCAKLAKETWIDSTIRYIDTVLDSTKPYAAPDREFSVKKYSRVTLFILNPDSSIVNIPINLNLRPGHYRIYHNSTLFASRFLKNGNIICYTLFVIGKDFDYQKGMYLK